MARKEGQAPPVVVVIEADCSSSPATETTRDHDAQMHGAPAQPKGASTPPSTSAQPGLTAGGEAYSSSGLTYDEALDQYVGQFGVGQLASFLLAGLVWIPNAGKGIRTLMLADAPSSTAAAACKLFQSNHL